MIMAIKVEEKACLCIRQIKCEVKLWLLY